MFASIIAIIIVRIVTGLALVFVLIFVFGLIVRRIALLVTVFLREDLPRDIGFLVVVCVSIIVIMFVALVAVTVIFVIDLHKEFVGVVDHFGIEIGCNIGNHQCRDDAQQKWDREFLKNENVLVTG